MVLADLTLLLALYLVSCLAICAWLELGERPVPRWLRSALSLYSTLFVALAVAIVTIVALARKE